jgi:hypothetical protein
VIHAFAIDLIDIEHCEFTENEELTLLLFSSFVLGPLFYRPEEDDPGSPSAGQHAFWSPFDLAAKRRPLTKRPPPFCMVGTLLGYHLEEEWIDATLMATA